MQDRQFRDLVGLKVGRLQVVAYVSERATSRNKRIHKWRCRCECGKIKEIEGPLLTRTINPVRSCGCLLKSGGKHLYTHGLSKKHKKEYNAYVAMIRRCTVKDSPAYPDYGGRGITICKRWLKSFKYFFEDMGVKPTNDLTLERVNTNKGYSKSNCRWDTRKVQSENKRNNVVVFFNGKSKILKRWCEELKLPYRTIGARITRGKWSPQEALSIPIGKSRSTHR